MKKLRLDKILADMGYGTRSEIAGAVRAGLVTVDGAVVRDSAAKVDPESAGICYDGEEVIYREHFYIMLNKPEGCVSATEDNFQKTVMSLVPEQFLRAGCFPCGRLDIDTVGLLIITNDGEAAHRRLSPRHHASKVYRFRLSQALAKERISEIEGGITLSDGTVTRPAKLDLSEDGLGGEITLTEGMFHEVKRIFQAAGTKVTRLERIEFAGIKLDPELAAGQWRFLTSEEERLFTEK